MKADSNLPILNPLSFLVYFSDSQKAPKTQLHLLNTLEILAQRALEESGNP